MDLKRITQHKKIILAISCVVCLVIGILLLGESIPHRLVGLSINQEFEARSYAYCLFFNNTVPAYLCIAGSILFLNLLFKIFSAETGISSNCLLSSLGIAGFTVFYALYDCEISTISFCSSAIPTPFFSVTQIEFMQEQLSISEESAQSFFWMMLICLGITLVGLFLSVKPFGFKNIINLLLNRETVKEITAEDPKADLQVYSCPRCGNNVLHGTPSCSQCGQSFDWSLL